MAAKVLQFFEIYKKMRVFFCIFFDIMTEINVPVVKKKRPENDAAACHIL